SQIEQYMAQGIEVQYLAFPRMGPASEDFRKMVSVWCAKDRRQALTLAKLDKPVPEANCTNPVAMQYRLGQRAGLEGTPMVLAEDGTQLGGYVPPVELRRMLDELAAGAGLWPAGRGTPQWPARCQRFHAGHDRPRGPAGPVAVPTRAAASPHRRHRPRHPRARRPAGVLDRAGAGRRPRPHHPRPHPACG